MPFRTRALIVNIALIALFLVVFIPLFLYDPLSDSGFTPLLSLPVAAIQGLVVAAFALGDASVGRAKPKTARITTLRIASALAAIAHCAGWGSWVFLFAFPQENPINITGIVGPGLGCVLSFVAIIAVIVDFNAAREGFMR